MVNQKMEMGVLAFGKFENWKRKTGEEKLDIFDEEWRKQFGDEESEVDWGLGSDDDGDF
ncbi:hypothetical protein L873DRAFT_1822854 [Choiromyces venosus 120613-1]|uniref:Uncharacterized protein n=1 Tax=Choiromyces venosus 120613-1 TaxID=1336337 RepID=A0A3N4IYY4_9PEZI|nr:hypothetical protein L873DRAFT_1822854 [Choiromyces venosus 120613-1]